MNIPSTEPTKRRGRPRKRRLKNGRKREWLPYQVVKMWVQKMGFRNRKRFKEYQKIYKLPPKVPSNPDVIYKGQYEGDTIFYGKKIPRFLNYWQGRQLVQTLGIKSIPQYREYVTKYETPKLHLKLPSLPYNTWKDQWTNWGDFLQSGNKSPTQRHKEMLSYDQAKAFVHQLNLKNLQQWRDYAASGKCPTFIPKWPERTYDEYNIRDWLGLDVLSALETRMDQPGVWAIVYDLQDESNVLQLKTFKGGKGEAVVYAKQHNCRIIRLYNYEYELLSTVHDIIKQNSSSFTGGTFVATNFNQLRFDLDMTLLIVK